MEKIKHITPEAAGRNGKERAEPPSAAKSAFTGMADGAHEIDTSLVQHGERTPGAVAVAPISSFPLDLPGQVTVFSTGGKPSQSEKKDKGEKDTDAGEQPVIPSPADAGSGRRGGGGKEKIGESEPPSEGKRPEAPKPERAYREARQAIERFIEQCFPGMDRLRVLGKIAAAVENRRPSDLPEAESPRHELIDVVAQQRGVTRRRAEKLFEVFAKDWTMINPVEEKPFDIDTARKTAETIRTAPDEPTRLHAIDDLRRAYEQARQQDFREQEIPQNVRELFDLWMAYTSPSLDESTDLFYFLSNHETGMFVDFNSGIHARHMPGTYTERTPEEDQRILNKDEIREMQNVMNDLQISKPFMMGKELPDTQYISRAHMALYSYTHRNPYVGRGETWHPPIAKRIGINTDSSVFDAQKSYLSMHAYQLKQPEQMVFVIIPPKASVSEQADVDSLMYEAIQDMLNKGYVLLDSTYAPLVPDPTAARGYRRIPS